MKRSMTMPRKEITSRIAVIRQTWRHLILRLIIRAWWRQHLAMMLAGKSMPRQQVVKAHNARHSNSMAVLLALLPQQGKCVTR